jgi:hypothetical protein
MSNALSQTLRRTSGEHQARLSIDNTLNQRQSYTCPLPDRCSSHQPGHDTAGSQQWLPSDIHSHLRRHHSHICERRIMASSVRHTSQATRMHIPLQCRTECLACSATSSPSPSSAPRRCRHSRTSRWQPTPPSQVVLASLVLTDVRRPSSAVVTDAAGVRLLSAVDPLVLRDARRVSSAILAIATAERLLTAVAALVLRDI